MSWRLVVVLAGGAVAAYVAVGVAVVCLLAFVSAEDARIAEDFA